MANLIERVREKIIYARQKGKDDAWLAEIVVRTVLNAKPTDSETVWRFPTENAEAIGHPTPFPEELPRRLILLYTEPGDTVLDPFMGSGTTCVAARRLGRGYVGYDVSPEYCAKAQARLDAVELTLREVSMK